MADVIRNFKYKTAGRGRGVLGLKDLRPCRRPGEKAAVGGGGGTKLGDVAAPPETLGTAGNSKKAVVVVALYNYTANPGCPGGFTELTIKAGQILQLLGEHEDNEHWWKVEDEDGNVGCVPASYVLKKEQQALPWLELAALHNEEAERKERVKRLQQQKAAKDGIGFGPSLHTVVKPYVSAYGKSGSVAAPGSKQYYCEVCKKQLNGPKPYQAHMASKAHREELALLES